MRKAVWSKVWLSDTEDKLIALFNDCIGDLLKENLVKEMDNFEQHIGTSRLQHSINVAYYSFLICKKLKLDYRSAARAGILHDLFLYDWREEKQPEGKHAFAHPIVALRNAKKIANLNPIEEDAIVKHMWPITPAPPKYMESFAVTFADKFCAMAEMVDSSVNLLFNKSMILSCMVSGGVYGR